MVCETWLAPSRLLRLRDSPRASNSVRPLQVLSAWKRKFCRRANRAFLDGGTAFAPGVAGFRAIGTRVRIPVRPRQQVCYADWNNKRSLRVGVGPGLPRAILAARAAKGSVASGQLSAWSCPSRRGRAENTGGESTARCAATGLRRSLCAREPLNERRQNIGADVGHRQPF